MAKHGADWSDWDIHHPEEDPSCLCGYNGTPEDCELWRTSAAGGLAIALTSRTGDDA